MHRPQIHLIANSHLDPVWLWDRYEGMNEAIATVRAVLDLMDRWPDLTYIRGEAALYDHIRRRDPESFQRIQNWITAGRWDVVGGNWIQPDTNLPRTEALCRQYDLGMAWFRQYLGRQPTCAWAADSFGHGAGFPEIYAKAGFDSFVFSRPLEEQLSLPAPLFWWEGEGGQRILSYRLEGHWYGMERDEMMSRLDKMAAIAGASPLRMTALFYGLGNHGGGPTERHLREIAAWQKQHPEVELVHSGLHRLMDAFRNAMNTTGWEAPVFRGELNFCLRGCYASSMRTKIAYRKAEAAVLRAEAAQAAACLNPAAPPQIPFDWRSLCFNAFHDILPGTSIETATTRQITAMHRIIDEARDREEEAVFSVASRLVHPDFRPLLPDDFPLPQPVLLFNPHPFPFKGVVPIETAMDYRLLLARPDSYDRLPLRVMNASLQDLPFQRMEPRNRFLPRFPWRMHVAVEVNVPAMGYSLAYPGRWPDHHALPEIPDPVSGSHQSVSSSCWQVCARPADGSVSIRYLGNSLFGDSGGLRVRAVRDTFGSWGGHYDEPGSADLQETIEYWRIDQTRVLESGPLLARLWVRFTNAARSSRMDLTARIQPGDHPVEWEARLLWTEVGQRLKIEFPAGPQAVYEVPGGTVRRRSAGEVPGQRTVAIDKADGSGSYGFVSDSLTNYNLGHGRFQATLVRTTDFACDKSYDSSAEPWRPLHDQGELLFRFLFSGRTDSLHKAAAFLENPVGWWPVARQDGSASVTGMGLQLKPDCMEVLGIRPSVDQPGHLQLRILNHGSDARPELTVAQQRRELPPIRSGTIAEYLLPPEWLHPGGR